LKTINASFQSILSFPAEENLDTFEFGITSKVVNLTASSPKLLRKS